MSTGLQHYRATVLHDMAGLVAVLSLFRRHGVNVRTLNYVTEFPTKPTAPQYSSLQLVWECPTTSEQTLSDELRRVLPALQPKGASAQTASPS